MNLSDLAAKAAEPYGYIMTIGFPPGFSWPLRRSFAEGLKQDQRTFGLKLLGGDTTATPGPLTASVTMFGWAKAGGMLRRATAKPDDVVLVSGTIGDGWLGLAALRADIGADEAHVEHLAGRYHLPQPRMALAEALRGLASAAADISDGLIADAVRIGRASGLSIELDLDSLPVSPAARAWLERQDDPLAATIALAAGGDDYEVVCTAEPRQALRLISAAAMGGTPMTAIGRVAEGEGVRVFAGGREWRVPTGGWRHG